MGLNAPFAGAIVPSQYFGKDSHVTSAMIEVRRDLYLDEATGIARADFGRIAQTIRECVSGTLLALAL